MAPRKPSKRRDYKAETARRNEVARQRGAGSYYEERVRGTERGSRERAKARGHASDDYATLLKTIRKFIRELDTGDYIVMPEGIKSVQRDTRGRYVRIYKMVFDAGDPLEIRYYEFFKMTKRRLIRLIEQERSKGASWSPAPSLDQRRLPKASESEGGY